MARIAAETPLDLEACEFFLRDAVLTAGAGILEKALGVLGQGRRAYPVRCPRCAQPMRSVGIKPKTLRSILGKVTFRRSLFVCPRCHKAFFPSDRTLGVEDGNFTPGALRLIARAASKTSFADAAEDLALYANLQVAPKTIQRQAERIGREIALWMEQLDYEILNRQNEVEPTPTLYASILYIEFDGTGIPVRRIELAGRAGKQPDGAAKTREVKIGCVFTQTAFDEEGKPVRDPHSTTYVAAIESSDAFGKRLYAETLRRGLGHYTRVVIITDGARYNQSIIEMHFPNAVRIIDYYHAKEHLNDTVQLLVSEKLRQTVAARWLELLDAGDIETLTCQMRQTLPRTGERRQEGLRAIAYFDENASFMRYQHFKNQGFFLGSGVIEAGCKSLIGKRLKDSGMFWSVQGANDIIALRCCIESRRFEDFWEQRHAKTH